MEIQKLEWKKSITSQRPGYQWIVVSHIYDVMSKKSRNIDLT